VHKPTLGDRVSGFVQSKAIWHFFSILAVVAWVVAGAAVFTYFESDRQAAQLLEYKAAVRSFQEKYAVPTDDLASFLSVVGAPELDQYHTLDTAESTEPYGYYFPSLYTASTTFAIITTVGYGKVAPETDGGKLFLIFSIVFGIPCIGLLLERLSKIMFRLFERVQFGSLGADEVTLKFKQIDRNHSHTLDMREMRKAARGLVEAASNWVDEEWMEQIVRNDGRVYGDGIYWDGGCSLRTELPEFTLRDFKHLATELHLPFKQADKAQKRAFLAAITLVFWVLAGSIVYTFAESLAWLDALYFSIVTLSTVGLGDITPQTVAGVIFTFFFDIVGLELMAINLGTISESMNERGKRLAREARASAKKMLNDPNTKRHALEFTEEELKKFELQIHREMHSELVVSDQDYERWRTASEKRCDALDENIAGSIEQAKLDTQTHVVEQIAQQLKERAAKLRRDIANRPYASAAENGNRRAGKLGP
jgi:voltage-gated potassium channel Kch